MVALPTEGNSDMWRFSKLALAVTLAVALLGPQVSAAEGRVPSTSAGQSGTPKVTKLATFVNGPCADDICGSGSTVGPDGALYVTDSTNGRIQRVHPRSGNVKTYADGLPLQIEGVIGGGVADIAFRGGTAYVLVTGVSEFWTELVGSTNAPAAEGIYRLDSVGKGTTRTTLIADIYTWSEAHPPTSPNFFVPGGYTYSMQAYRNGFLVADAHHNRILRVRLNGRISVFKDFAKNVVPTGLERIGRRTVLVGQAGPVPHTPETGRVVALARRRSDRAARLGCPAARRRGGRPAASPVRACAGQLAVRGSGGQGRLPGRAEHRPSDAGQPPWSVPERRFRTGPPDDVRNHRRHGLRGHDHREGAPDLRARPVTDAAAASPCEDKTQRPALSPPAARLASVPPSTRYELIRQAPTSAGADLCWLRLPRPMSQDIGEASRESQVISDSLS